MNTSKKTDYALHALIIMARNKNLEYSASELAAVENVSASYLAKVMQILSNNNIVRSSEGKTGGYKLNKKAEDISVAEIVEILEEKENVFDCVDEVHGCTIRDRCKIHAVFKEAYQEMLKKLMKTSIADIMYPEIK
jgi:Rrf2 family nitric oxide-sensitive transcriptional repressor